MNNSENTSAYTQRDIDNVWQSEWSKEENVPIKKQFSRLFEEGYRVYKKFLPKSPFILLEIGAGSGRYGVAIARDYPDAEVVLTDPLVESTRLIARAIHDLHLPNASVKKADSLNLDFPDGSFDVVFADVVIQHIIDRDRALSEMLRVLRPGGRLVLSVVNTNNPPHALLKLLLRLKNNPYHYGYERTYTPKEFQNLFQSHKLNSIVQDGFYAAYGVYRWGYTYSIWKFVGRIMNRFLRYVDVYTNRFVSKNFGFIIVCVGEKPQNEVALQH
jgi:ubiquinone/menaquinone biosynthesis C-methylase UbiE